MNIRRLILVPVAALALAAPAQGGMLDVDGSAQPAPQLGIGVGDDTPFAQAPAADPAPHDGSNVWTYIGLGVGLGSAFALALAGRAVGSRRHSRPETALT